MEIRLENAYSSLIREYAKFSSIFRLTIFLVITVVALFVLGPDDSEISFPSMNGSRFLWTPVIPVISSLCVGIWTYLALSNRLSIVEVKIASFGVPFLIFISIQFSTTSPVGVDGWFFLTSSQYYSMFGQDGAANYMSHPLVMMPVDIWIRTFGSNGRVMASFLGLSMSLVWIGIIVRSVSRSPNFSRFGTLVLAGLSLFFLLTGWFPLRYSAHLLALLLGHTLMHSSKQNVTTITDVILSIMLGISHAFSPIVFGTVFFLESLFRSENAQRSRNLGLIISVTFILWNRELPQRVFSFYDPQGGFSDIWVLAPFILISLLFFIFSSWFEKKMGSRDGVIFGGGFGVSNLAVTIGCILCIPIVLIADTQTGAARFTHRLVTYGVVPFCWSGTWILTKIFEMLENKIEDYGDTSKFLSITIIFLAASNGIGSGVLQVSFAGNTEVMPENTVHCWDMVESTGALNALAGEWDGDSILISDQIHPPLVTDKYFSFVKQGDGDKIRLIDQSKMVGVLETPDMFQKIATETTVNFENWTVQGEVPGACRLWINPTYLGQLDNTMTWEKLDTSWY